MTFPPPRAAHPQVPGALKGKIADIMVWNAALSEDLIFEISDSNYGINSELFPRPSNIVAYYVADPRRPFAMYLENYYNDDDRCGFTAPPDDDLQHRRQELWRDQSLVSLGSEEEKVLSTNRRCRVGMYAGSLVTESVNRRSSSIVDLCVCHVEMLPSRCETPDACPRCACADCS